MQLRQLLAGLTGIVAVRGLADPQIHQITADSRQVTPGALFVAYQGIGADGHRFTSNAIGRGAAAVVAEQAMPDPPVPYIQVEDGRAALAWLMAAWFGHPSRAMTLVGVTGTDGKTTTANLIYSILRAAGRQAGLISTVNAVIGGETYDTGLHTTTPDAGDVQRYLDQMRAAGTEVAVLETTSHGLAQHRVTGCAFDVAVVTNITHEHLDFHGSYEAYRQAKAMLFRTLADPVSNPPKPDVVKTAVLNRDDASYPFLAAIPVPRQFTYGLRPPDTGDPAADGATALTAGPITRRPGATIFDVDVQGPEGTPAGTVRLALRSPLQGDFNVSNVLAATGAALALGLPPDAIEAGVRNLAGIPGRMERIDAGQDFLAFVDFAHTPNALARALEAAKPLAASGGRILVVFGSAGLRDRDKRRMMGEVAAHLAGYVVITAEDPRTEDLAAIMAETSAACRGAGSIEGKDYVCIPDRQRAIWHAVQQARPGDVVLVCGKGHEQSMCFGQTEHPWRDQEAIQWALARLQGRASAEPPYVLPTWTED
jgi:UDP-N-acetylmuramoyl-L-alanyl-D-glutamate--2,6-diaminopimelate ligase